MKNKTYDVWGNYRVALLAIIRPMQGLKLFPSLVLKFLFVLNYCAVIPKAPVAYRPIVLDVGHRTFRVGLNFRN